jgi:hypothetical protein
MGRVISAFTVDAEEKALVDYTRLMHSNQKLTSVIASRAISGVRQDGPTLNLDFADGSTLQIKLADAASSVMLRDKQGKMEYTD